MENIHFLRRLSPGSMVQMISSRTLSSLSSSRWVSRRIRFNSQRISTMSKMNLSPLSWRWWRQLRTFLALTLKLLTQTRLISGRSVKMMKLSRMPSKRLPRFSLIIYRLRLRQSMSTMNSSSWWKSLRKLKRSARGRIAISKNTLIESKSTRTQSIRSSLRHLTKFVWACSSSSATTLTTLSYISVRNSSTTLWRTCTMPT